MGQPKQFLNLVACDDGQSPIFDGRHPTGARAVGNSPVLLFAEDFTNYNNATSLGMAAQSGGAWSIEADGGGIFAGQPALKCAYPDINNVSAPFVYGSVPASAIYPATQLNNHVYFSFWVKQPAAVKHGCKMWKIFGYNPRENPTYNAAIASNYANATFGVAYSGSDNGQIVGIGSGSGVGVENDTTTLLRLDGSSTPSELGRNYGAPGFDMSEGQNSIFLASDWGTDWHHVQGYIKFNSGDSPETEINDGEELLIIDGVVRRHGKNMFNRHYSNGPIYKIGVAGTSQGVSNGPFEYWYKNITVSQFGWIIL